MVFRQISEETEDIKNRALFLFENGYIPEDICELLGISERSFRRWKRNQLEFGSVILVPHTDPLDQGRPRILNADMTHDLITLSGEVPYMFLDEIQDWFAIVHDVKI
jgi:hypothetical protein